ncbi:MAG: signal peptidase I [Candidatus Moranbacteria bacterium]|nr:signal peptidase I [Candidatus Moranbacteria bacterium]
MNTSSFSQSGGNDSEQEVYQGFGAFFLEIIKVFILALVIIVPVRVFLFQPFFVQGASMEPNFHNGEYLIINEFGYKQTSFGDVNDPSFSVTSWKDLERGDVVVFRYPNEPSQFFIKRVIGLPGETVKIARGQVHIINERFPDGIVLDETDYLDSDVETISGTMTTTLSDDEYFVMGDNRGASHDSRTWGPLPKNMMIGRVLVRAWPLNRLGVL